MGRPGCTSRGLAAAVVSVSLLLMTSAATARAATFAVTRFDDPSLTGPCRPGNCSLREAIRAAGLAHGTNTILAPKGTYTLSIPNQPLEVVGTRDTIKAVHGRVTVDANRKTTDTLGIHVLSGGHLTLDNVIEEHGVAPVDTDGVARGGGIRVDQRGSLTMNGGGVLFNIAKGEGAEGAGIYSNGQLTLNGVGVADNIDSGTPSFGGAIFTDSHGATTVTGSEFFDNAAASGGGFAGSGTLDVSRSLMDGNKADEGGGADPEDARGTTSPTTRSHPTTLPTSAGRSMTPTLRSSSSTTRSRPTAPIRAAAASRSRTCRAGARPTSSCATRSSPGIRAPRPSSRPTAATATARRHRPGRVTSPARVITSSAMTGAATSPPRAEI